MKIKIKDPVFEFVSMSLAMLFILGAVVTLFLVI